MPSEDAAAYEELRRGLWQTLKPANDTERLLAGQSAATAWRLMRAQRVETAFLGKLTEGSEDSDDAIALAFPRTPEGPRANPQLCRGRAQRLLQSHLQKDRGASEPQNREVAASPEERNSEIRSVSYHNETAISDQPHRASNTSSGHGDNRQQDM
jgi:hypothetical protein